MDNLNNIPNVGNWGDAASKLNDNFNKIRQSLTTVENVSKNNKGYFSSLSALNTAFPSPKAGQTAYVYDEESSTKYYIYNAVNGAWVASSIEAPSVGVDLSDYTLTGGSTKTTKQLEDDLEQLAYVKINNEVVNGDFENGLIEPFTRADGDGGASTLAINSLAPISGNYDAKLTIITPSTADWRPLFNGLNRDANIGDKIYLHFYAKILSGTPIINGISNGAGNSLIYGGDVVNGRNTRIIDVVGTGHTGVIYFNSLSVWDMQMDNFMRINLTETFGAGNEPTEEEMNLLLDMLAVDYFEGEITIPLQKIVQWQLELANTAVQNANDEIAQLADDVIGGQAENIFPDPFFLSEDITKQTGVEKLITTGTPVFEKGRVIIPAGSFAGVFLDLDLIGLDPLSEYFNGRMNGEIPTGGLVSIAIDYLSSGVFHSPFGYFTLESPGVYTAFNMTGYDSLSSQIRVTFDNRDGSSDMVIERFLLWKGQDVKPYGFFLREAWQAFNLVNDLVSKEPIYNIAPYYTEWTLIKGQVLSAERDFISLSTPGSIAYYGFEFLLNSSNFKVGDSIHYGVKNVDVTGSGLLQLFCIFYNGSTEISRLTTNLSDSTYLTPPSGVIPENTTRILIRFQISGDAAVSISAEDFILSETPLPETFDGRKWVRSPMFGEGAETGNVRAVAYVDALTGDDDNDGLSWSAPFATFKKAIETTGAETTIFFRGETTESLNIKTKANQNTLRLIGLEGRQNRIIKGTKIEGATLVAGETNVYQVPMTTFSAQTQFWLFQHGLNDENTLISDEERHPLQRGKSHRCDSVRIIRTTTLEDVKTSTESKFFYDDVNLILYFKAVEGSDITINPIYIPGGTAISGNDGTVKFEMINIEAYYGHIQLANSHGAKISDCAAKYAFSGGGFRWDNAVGVELIRCEATNIFTGSGTGDGFNAHSSYPNPDQPEAKHTVATMIDCWSHDNADDGYSDHERCETTIIGGLFEYNVKAGLTPAYGAHDTIQNAYCRKNVNGGISLIGSATTAEGGVGSQIIVTNCISEGNTNNYYVSGSTGSYENKGIFINCVSLNASGAGYKAENNARVILINCSDSGSTLEKDGTITVQNANIVQ